MISKKDIEIEARLVALEFLTAQLFCIHYDQMGFSDDQVAEQRRKMKEFGRELSVEGAGDAAMGDHVTAEIVDQIDAALELVDRLRKLYRGNQ